MRSYQRRIYGKNRIFIQKIKYKEEESGGMRQPLLFLNKKAKGLCGGNGNHDGERYLISKIFDR